MINLGWGGYPNGRLPQSALVQVSSKPDYLEASAGAQWLRMRQACYNATGHWINIAPGSSAYRDYGQQGYFWDQYQNHNGNVAAVPGTSNHGWGRAVDLTGYESSDAVWNWLINNAGTYGYSWQTGKASGERWHWESLTAPGTVVVADSGASTIIERTDDEEMISKEAQDWFKLQLSQATTVNLYRNTANGSIAIADVSKGFWREFGSMPDLQTLQALGVFYPDEQMQSIGASTYNGIKGECIKAAQQFLRFAQTGK